MPPVFGPLVAVEDALVVLRRGERHRALAVAQRQQRELLAVEELLDDHVGRAEDLALEHVDERLARLGLVLGDHHALAGGQPVGLDDHRVAVIAAIPSSTVATCATPRSARPRPP